MRPSGTTDPAARPPRTLRSWPDLLASTAACGAFWAGLAALLAGRA